MADWRRDPTISEVDDPEGRIESRDIPLGNMDGSPTEPLICASAWRVDSLELEVGTSIATVVAVLRKKMFNEHYERLKRVEAMLSEMNAAILRLATSSSTCLPGDAG